VLDHRINRRRIALEQAIADHGQHAARRQHPTDFGVKPVKIKPMDGLRHHDQVETLVWGTAMLRRLQGIPDAGMLRRLVELLFADICGIDLVKMFSQQGGYLAIAGAAIPGRLTPGRQGRQVGDQFGWVSRPKPGIQSGLSREIIFHYKAANSYLMVNYGKIPHFHFGGQNI
jgi:hypothetical protein